MAKPFPIPTPIPTRYALIKRAEKILADIDQYFADANDFGVTVAEADPRGELVNIRQGLIAMLKREGRLPACASKRTRNETR